MDQDLDELDSKDRVFLPSGNVYVYFEPIENVVHNSPLLSSYNFEDLCFYISVPKTTCTIGHLTNYLDEKFSVSSNEENPMWAFPFLIFVKLEGNNITPIPKPITMDQLMQIHTQCYDSSEKRFSLYYTHNYAVREVPANPSSPAAVFNSSPAPSSEASTSSTDSDSDV